MFRKNKKQTETIKEPKEKKVRTFKVGTHKKSVIALWVVLIASVSFGAYKNFTAIDQHTTHEKEIIELRLQDTNGIENFVKNFAKPYYTWSNSKEAIEARTQAISGYLMCAYLDSTHLFFFDIFCLFLILLKHNVILTFYCFTRPAPIKCCCQ